MRSYDRIRNIPELRACFGAKLVDITETDRDERLCGEPDVVVLHFDNGTTITFPMRDDGFNVETPG